MTETQLHNLLTALCASSTETEWVEFKHNNADPEMIGERISALANAAALLGKERAYFVWGVEDHSHKILGTTFAPQRQKIGGEDFEPWLTRMLNPHLDLRFHFFQAQGRPIVLLEITPCRYTPVRWKEFEYIRIGSHTKKLNDYPEKERTLWGIFARQPFERRIALDAVSEEDALRLLDYDTYLRLMKQALPSTRKGLLELLCSERTLVARPTGDFDVTNLGAILFARKLSDFDTLKRKAVRVIRYSDK